jgi:hypothetical protein
MMTVIEHTFNQSHHRSSVQDTLKVAKMPARFVDLDAIFPFLGIHFIEQKLPYFPAYSARVIYTKKT